MTFVKNQLSLSLIGLSPLILNHLCILQHTKVRSNTCLRLNHLVSGLILIILYSFDLSLKNISSLLILTN